MSERERFYSRNTGESYRILYLCYPNNPTGTALSKQELKKWVNYALSNDTLILFDAAYEAYIQDSDVPHSIYEIKGAKNVLSNSVVFLRQQDLQVSVAGIRSYRKR